MCHTVYRVMPHILAGVCMHQQHHLPAHGLPRGLLLSTPSSAPEAGTRGVSDLSPHGQPAAVALCFSDALVPWGQVFRAEVPPIPQSANRVRPHKPSSGMWKSSPHLHPTLCAWDGEIASETPGATVQIVKCVWQGGEGEGGVGGGEVHA